MQTLAITRPGAPFPVTRRDFLHELRESDEAYRAIQARRFELMAQLDVLWSEADDSGAVIPGTERRVPAGNDGTPLVAEFAPLEVAAAMHLRTEAVEVELSLATDCLHRLPRAWDKSMTGELRVWQAQKLASLASDLTLEAARAFDAELSPVYGRMPFARVEAYAKGLVLMYLPAEVADEHRANARERRHVTFAEAGDDLLGSVTAVLDKPDQRDLEQQVKRIAAILTRAGCPDTENGIRARALAILANPAHALQLLQASLLDPDCADPSILTADDTLFTPAPQAGTHPSPELVEGYPCQLAERLGHTCGTITTDPAKLLPTAQVVVHLTDATAQTGDGVARVDGLGAALGGWLKDLLGHRSINVRPVLDSASVLPVDCYEVPDRMREVVERRTPFEVFPWSTKRAERCDLDHTEPYEFQGRDGQTRPANLGPLGRRVHRAKTHGRWRLESVAPGCFLWRSPEGFIYLVTPSLSLELHDPTRMGPPRVMRFRASELTSTA